MAEAVLTCRSELRRDKTREAGFNGLDYLEVSEDQYTLHVYFFGKAPLLGTGHGPEPEKKKKKKKKKRRKEPLREPTLVEANVQIRGGRRVRDIKVVDLSLCKVEDEELDDCLSVTVDRIGDFSTYTLCLVDLDEDGRPTDRPFPGFDPRYACLDFSFKVGCPSDLDCKTEPECPPEEKDEPDIDYLAKDYRGFRKLILDRLALIMPDWCERHVPDVGITLVELLAYAGDRLSYFQDAVATEAYLQTARQRVSVRRHARLVDYALHEGCNARAWVCLRTASDTPLELGNVSLLAASTLPESKRVLKPSELAELPRASTEIFEPLTLSGETTVRLLVAHNRISFYTWGDEECCLPKGATAATLKDEWQVPDTADPEQTDPGQKPPEQEPYGQTPDEWADERDDAAEACPEPPTPPQRPRRLALEPGDVLILEEVIGPGTGNPADADPTHRHAICLTRVEPGIDPVCDEPVVEIEWAEEDALPFALCLSTIGPAPECRLLEDVSVACGNVLLVDHGESCDEALGKVPTETSEETCGDACRPPEVVTTAGDFRPRLEKSPLTHSEPLERLCPATGRLEQDPRKACAQVSALETSAEGEPRWMARRDLLASGRDDRHFVVEIDNNGRGRLRFGDGELGRRPDAGAELEARYRVGNGPAGNVGAESIRYMAFRENWVSGVSVEPRNPLPAQGGVAREGVEQAKLFAPHRFRKELARAITAADYAAIVERDFSDRVQRAAATLRWTGSRYQALVAVDQRGRLEAETELLREIETHLRDFRRMGHDLKVVPALHVPLDLALTVCVRPDFLRGHVEAEVREALSNRTLASGRRGFFHPDNLSFGEGVFLSRIVALVQSLDGVESVVVDRLERLGEGPNREIELGRLALGSDEIARLDNDASFPENGRLELTMGGGR